MKKFAKIFLIISTTFLLAVILIIETAQKDTPKVNKSETQTQNEDTPKWLIAEHDYGENYPYTKYYLTIYAYNNGVWLEDNYGNKYALNGIAINLLKNNKKYKGSTALILKSGKVDLFSAEEALKYAINLTDGQFNAIMKVGN